MRRCGGVLVRDKPTSLCLCCLSLESRSGRRFVCPRLALNRYARHDYRVWGAWLLLVPEHGVVEYGCFMAGLLMPQLLGLTYGMAFQTKMASMDDTHGLLLVFRRNSL